MLERQKVSWLGEAGAALLLGCAVGLVVRHTHDEEHLDKWLAFKTDFFFIAILPPIIFHAGFSMDVKPFMNNVGAICTYAFAGTAISTAVIGVIMDAAGNYAVCYNLSTLQALLYGAIVSATDPVTVLAVFERLRADSNLYALIFGESVLNDAVALVLYATLLQFRNANVTGMSIVHGISVFMLIFVGSLAIGVVSACLVALLLRGKWLRSEHAPLESGLLAITAYASYYLATGLGLSGIVSILFCGMAMSKYARPNLSPAADRNVSGFFQLLAHTTEVFVFLYIGTSAVLQKGTWNSLTLGFAAVSLVALAVSRFINVYLLSYIINTTRPRERRIPPSHQFALWWSGLRGAMAFALAIKAKGDLPDDDSGSTMAKATFILVLATVLFNGGWCTHLLDSFHLREGTPGHTPLGDVGARTRKGVAREESAGVKGLNGMVQRLDEQLQSVLVNQEERASL